MQPKQFAIITAIAVLSAALGVVATTAIQPKEVKFSIDLGEGEDLDLTKLLGEMGDLEGARIRANENAAIATLRSIASAQSQIQAAGVIDSDGDTGGEYAYLGELAGTAPLRGGSASMHPPLLVSSLGNVNRAGIAHRSGYLFRVFLPGKSVGERLPGLPEGSGSQPDPDAAEIFWCAYAWPTEAGKTGSRAFFISHEGELTAATNTDGTYSGEDSPPAFDVAMSSQSPNDMASIAASSTRGQTSNDGRAWSSLGH